MDYILICFAPILTAILLLIKVKYTKILVFNIFAVLTCSLAMNFFARIQSADFSGFEKGMMIDVYVSQLEKIISNKNILLMESYVEDLKRRQGIFFFNYDEKIKTEFYQFIDFWDAVLLEGKNISFEYFDIIPENSRYATLVDKAGNTIIENASISMWGKYPYLYGTYINNSDKIIMYGFIIDLREMKIFSEEHMGKTEFSKLFTKIKSEGYIVNKPVKFSEFKGKHDAQIKIQALRKALQDVKKE